MNFDSLAKELFPNNLLRGDKEFYITKSEGLITEDASLENHALGGETRELQLDKEHDIQKLIRPMF